MATTDDGGHIDWYLQRYRAMDRKNAESTFETRERQLRRFAEWHGGDLADVTPDDVEQFIIEMSNSDYGSTTIQGYRYALKKFYRQMEAKGRIEDDPIEAIHWEDFSVTGGVTRKKEESDEEERIHVLEPSEVQLLAENVPAPTIRNELLVRLMAQTGMRAHEVAKVTIDRLNREDRTVEVVSDKTSDKRTVVYQPSLSFLLSQWLDEGHRDVYSTAADSEYLFVTRKKPKMTRNTVNVVVSTAAENAGLQEVMYVDVSGNERKKITSHVLRHTFAVNALKPDVGGGSMNIRYLQEVMGHEDISTTQQYLQWVEQDAIEEMRKFGPSFAE